jgi:hypothetical protein
LNIDVEYFSAESGLHISSFFPPSLLNESYGGQAGNWK